MNTGTEGDEDEGGGGRRRGRRAMKTRTESDEDKGTLQKMEWKIGRLINERESKPFV